MSLHQYCNNVYLRSKRRISFNMCQYIKSYKYQQMNNNQHIIINKRNMSSSNIRHWGDNNYQNNQRVIYGIIIANVGIFVAWNQSERDYKLKRFMTNNFTLSTRALKDGYYHTLITSFFSHKDIWHLGFNMLTFYTFGSSIIMSIGIRSFLGLYMTGGIASSFNFILEPYYLPKSWYMMLYSDKRALGASGATSSIVYYSILMNPGQTILLFFVPMPAILGLLAFLLYDIHGMYVGDTSIGHSSHLAGATIGTSYFLYRRLRRY